MGIMLSSLQCLRRRAQELLRLLSTSTPVSLPNDVIVDILSRVPVKSQCRFRCVSRGWRAIISDPVFVEAQKSRPAQPFLVAGSSSESCLRLVDASGSVVRVINYTGWGWTPVCMSPIDDVLCYSNGAPVAGMVNLTTMKVLVTHLDPDRAWGCGRAVPSGAYKLVRFKYLECEVFTIGGGDGWRRRKSFRFRADHSSCDNYTPAVNGVLHFLAVALPDEPGSVLRFDLETEEWKSRIKGPPSVKLGRPDITLGELNGHLCIVEPGTCTNDFGYTSIWKLLTDSDESTWVKAYMLPLDQSTYYQMMPLRAVANGRKVIFRYNWLGGAPMLQIYDHSYDMCTNLMEELLDDHVSGIGFCSLHLESLMLPKIQYLKSSVCYI